MRGISRLGENLLASQRGISSMELVMDLVIGDRRRYMTSWLSVNFTYLVGSKLQNDKNNLKACHPPCVKSVTQCI